MDCQGSTGAASTLDAPLLPESRVKWAAEHETEGRYDAAAQQYRAAAAEGCREAWTRLAVVLWRAPATRSEALVAWKHAAEAGDADACEALSQRCREQEPPDVKGAVEWDRRAATAGHPQAALRHADRLSGVHTRHRTWNDASLPFYVCAVLGHAAGAARIVEAWLSEEEHLPSASTERLASAIRRAAAAGGVDALYPLEYATLTGCTPVLVTPLPELTRLFRHAAETGTTEALRAYARFLQTGCGEALAAHVTAAEPWWQKTIAATLVAEGHVHADDALEIAMCVRETDQKQFLDWLRVAAMSRPRSGKFEDADRQSSRRACGLLVDLYLARRDLDSMERWRWVDRRLAVRERPPAPKS